MRNVRATKATRVKGAAMPVDVHVGARVKAARLMAHMSQETLGGAIGVTFQQVQKYEQGSNRVSASRLHQIATHTARPIMFFFEGLDNPTATPDDPLQSNEAIVLVQRFFRMTDEQRAGILALMPPVPWGKTA